MVVSPACINTLPPPAPPLLLEVPEVVEPEVVVPEEAPTLRTMSPLPVPAVEGPVERARVPLIPPPAPPVERAMGPETPMEEGGVES